MSFDRVVCGIDLNEESREAARQAARLTPPGASILLVSAIEAPLVMEPGMLAGDWGLEGYDPSIYEALEEATRDNLERARAELGDARVETRLETGSAVATLEAEAQGEGASLIALGVHEEHRVLGILGGSVATRLVHRSPCSVLLARKPEAPGSFPRSIVVGTDGSEPAARAVRVARELAGRLGSELRALVAEPDRHGHREAAEPQLDGLEVTDDARSPVDALAAVSADLLVVGSSGRSGLRALGSVSERVAHKARASVLIVR